MYLEHFKLTKIPFTLTPNTDFFCDIPSHQEALNILLLSLDQGEGFIKIVGEVGTGKTLLCRMLLKTLTEEYITAYIPNPDHSAEGLRFALAIELGLLVQPNWSAYQLLEAIHIRLLDLHKAGKKTVLIIDEAQALPETCLEAIRLLTNLETEEKKLLQVVLFGQPELNTTLKKNQMRQLQQRITFSYQLPALSRQDLELYLNHRLTRAGYACGNIFSPAAKRRLYSASQGLPRILNILAHKSLLVAYGRGKDKVTRWAVSRAIADTESSSKLPWLITSLSLAALGLGSLLALYWNYGELS